MGPRLPIQFEIHPSSGVPIYRQLMDQLRSLVASGRIPAGSLVPSVRQMAEDLSVNLMTVSKAYARLEAEGVLERDRGIGMRVTASRTNGKLADRLEQIRPLATQLATLAWQLSLTNDQVLSVVQSALKDRGS